MPVFAGIIAAGGLGLRFQNAVGARPAVTLPKQLQSIAGKTVLQWSIDALLPHCSVIVVAAPAEHLELFKTHASQTVQVLPGGTSRAQSIALAFAQIPKHIPYILIHDAARPAVSNAVIERVKQGTLDHGAAIAALALTDTIKRVADGVLVATLDRSTLWAAQTPQGFRADWYRDALAASKNISSVTDDASLLETLGRKVHVVLGDERNRKLTTPEDWGYLVSLLTTWCPESS